MALVLGFALSWYAFPRIVVMPVLVDPRTGQLIDPRTGQIIAEPENVKPDPNKPGQPASTNQGDKKGDDAQPK